jgi:phosphohistidine phosphatase SixA
MLKRHLVQLVVALILNSLTTSLLAQSDGAWEQLKKPNAVVLFRHAYAPGGGDPSHFLMGDCGTQRNLDADGRAQAKRIGEQFRMRNIVVGAVRASQWCRTKDTADLAFPSLVKTDPVFNSFLRNRNAESQQTQHAKSQIASWRGPGVLVIVTHQVNITALTGIVPESGEGVVVSIRGENLMVVGRFTP